MKILTKVPKSVSLNLLQKRGVYPKPLKLDDTMSPRAGYPFLKEASGFESFFFSLEVKGELIPEKVERLKYLCSMSSQENTEYLMLDVPDELIFRHNYYDYTDFLYYTFDSGIDECTEEELENIKRAIINQVSNDEIIQVLVPFFKKEWVCLTAW